MSPRAGRLCGKAATAPVIPCVDTAPRHGFPPPRPLVVSRWNRSHKESEMPVVNEPDIGEHEARERELRAPDYVPADLREQKEKAWHEWMGIAVALTALLSILAVIVSVVALGSSGTAVKTVTAAAPA